MIYYDKPDLMPGKTPILYVQFRVDSYDLVHDNHIDVVTVLIGNFRKNILSIMTVLRLSIILKVIRHKNNVKSITNFKKLEKNYGIICIRKKINNFFF